MKTKKIRCSFDILRVKLWYEEILYQKGFSSTYQVEQYFDPLPGAGALGHQIHNKWANYKYGRHTPHQNLIDKVNLEIPSSRKIIASPLWALLKESELVDIQVPKWLPQLAPEIVVELEKNLSEFGQYFFKSPQSQRLCRLLPLASFNVLALLLMHWITEESREYRVWYARYIYQTLLVIGVEYSERALLHLIIPLLNTIETRVFQQTMWPEFKEYAGDEISYRKHIEILGVFQKHTIHSKLGSDIGQRKKIMSGILNGKYSLDGQINLLIPISL